MESMYRIPVEYSRRSLFGIDQLTSVGGEGTELDVSLHLT